jgi:CBS domain-containing protein
MAAQRSGVVVRNEDGTLAGVATLADVRRIPEQEREQTPIGTCMTRNPVMVRASEPLDAVLEQLTKAGIRWAPVLGEDVPGTPAHPIGSVSVASIMDAYHKAVAQGTRRMRSLVEGTVLVEVTVTHESPLAGKQLKHLHFPAQTLVVSIRRSGALIFPRGETELRSGDAVTFLTNPARETQLRAYLAGALADHIPDEPQPPSLPNNVDQPSSSRGTGVFGIRLWGGSRGQQSPNEALAALDEVSSQREAPPKV